MFLLIGLGNPGNKFENTRHNIGFIAIDEICADECVSFKNNDNLESKITDIEINGEKVKLVKPQTFMNESGRAAEKIKNYYKIDNELICVIYDDIDLEFGTIRVSFSGSSAGHKGIQSIIDHIGEDFWRIRIGIGRPKNIPVEKYVLQDFNEEEKLKPIIDRVREIVLKFGSRNLKTETINITNS